MDNETTISSLRESIRAFVKERDWEHYHTPKNLAESIVIESAELLELFQWDSDPRTDDVTQELSDVIIYSLGLANALHIDVSESIRDKLEKNASKYPSEKFKGNWSKPSKE